MMDDREFSWKFCSETWKCLFKLKLKTASSGWPCPWGGGRHKEMEGRGFSGLYKNSSEELFLKTVMESPIGMPVPTMEMLGFKTVSQSFRTDSEELFKRWLTNGEARSFFITYKRSCYFVLCCFCHGLCRI